MTWLTLLFLIADNYVKLSSSYVVETRAASRTADGWEPLRDLAERDSREVLPMHMHMYHLTTQDFDI